tara:strand:- start:1838 stop:2239 length:402 start_codon:yes stop_codon:yes gene_type:complete
MALPKSGAGYQIGDGNSSETYMSVQPTPATATVTATLTAAQILQGILVVDTGTTAASLTLPTVALLEATLSNSRNDSSFELSVINIGASSGTVTMLVGTGWTIVGLATVLYTTSSIFRARKTGDGSWTLYKLT